MDIDLPAGKYLVAVSGGVDSVVMLDLLAKLPDLELIVAHFDHGIRPDSDKDRIFVEELSKRYQLPFVFAEGRLGRDASEVLARDKRYEFLEKVREESGAESIITAHHQDDLLETMIINLLRGTGRLGLSSLKSTEKLKRPMLGFSKADIKSYAIKNKLVWHEDPTNVDTKYLRNYVRHELLPKLGPSGRAALLAISRQASLNNAEIEQALSGFLSERLDRYEFIMLPHHVSLDVMAAWLRLKGVRDFDKPTLERLVIAAKTARPGSRHNVIRTCWLDVGKDELALVTSDC